MLPPLKALSPPPQNRLTRRQFLSCLGVGSLTLASAFAASEGNNRKIPSSAQDETPRMVNGWLLRESDL